MMSLLPDAARTIQQDVFLRPQLHVAWRGSPQALIAEAELTPKPGLVRSPRAGAHTTCHSMSCGARASRLNLISSDGPGCQGVVPSSALREIWPSSVAGRSAPCSRRPEAVTRTRRHLDPRLLTAASAIHDEHRVPATAVAHTARAIASFEDKAAPRLVSHGDVMAPLRRRGRAARQFADSLASLMSRYPCCEQAASRGQGRGRKTGCLAQPSCPASMTCLLYRGGKAGACRGRRRAASAVAAAGGTGAALGRECLPESMSGCWHSTLAGGSGTSCGCAVSRCRELGAGACPGRCKPDGVRHGND